LTPISPHFARQRRCVRRGPADSPARGGRSLRAPSEIAWGSAPRALLARHSGARAGRRRCERDGRTERGARACVARRAGAPHGARRGCDSTANGCGARRRGAVACGGTARQRTSTAPCRC